MLSAEQLNEVQLVYAGAKEMTEGGHTYIHLPALKLHQGCNPRELEALLWLSAGGTYPTRLLLSQTVAGPNVNWSGVVVFGTTWQTWSWKDVPNSLPPLGILAEHLRGLR